MLQRIVNLSEAAEICGKSIPTIKDWAKRPGHDWVIQKGDKTTPWQIDVAALVAWRETEAVIKAAKISKSKGGRRVLPPETVALLERIPIIHELDQIDPGEAMGYIGQLCAAYSSVEMLLPRLATSLVLAGAPMKVVYTAYKTMAVVMVGFYCDMAKEMRALKHVDIDNDLKFEVPWGDDLDWSRTAKTAGEPVDIKAWEAHCAAMTKKYRLGPEHEHD